MKNIDFYKMSKIEIINYISAIKQEYNSLLSPFFNANETLKMRKYIYSLPFSEYVCDMFWEFLNNDLTYFDLIKMINLIKVI